MRDSRTGPLNRRIPITGVVALVVMIAVLAVAGVTLARQGSFASLPTPTVEAAAAQPSVNSISPSGTIDLVFTSSPTVIPGDSISITFRAQAGTTVFNTVGAFIDFDPTVFQVDAATPSGIWDLGSKQINNTLGHVDFQVGLTGGATFAGGNRNVGTIDLTILDTAACGPTSLVFFFDPSGLRDTTVFDGNNPGTELLRSATSGTITVTGCTSPTSTPTATSTSVPPTSTPTATNTSVPPTSTPTATATNTSVPPSSTPTNTATNTSVPPSSTPTATATNTSVPPSNTPTATNTGVPPTNTPTATATNTGVPPTSTPTATATNTSVPPTNTPTNTATVVIATNTPSATFTPSNTPVPPTATNSPTPSDTPTPVTPTNTPTPSDTPSPAPPTNTPTPSLTPSPGPSPTPSNTPNPNEPTVAPPTGTPVPAEYVSCDNLSERTNGAISGAGSHGIAIVRGSDITLRVSADNRGKLAQEVIGDAYCRPIMVEDRYVTGPEEIGDPGVVGLPVANAVDIFGLLPDGTPANTFTRVMQVCFRTSSGSLILFADSKGAPRTYVPISTYVSGEYTCAFIGRGGTLVQVHNR